MLVGEKLAALFDQEIACLHTLMDILNQEYLALTGANVAAIEQVTEAKHIALAEQATVAQARGALLVSAAFSDTSEGLEQLIQGCDNQSELESAFTLMTSLAQQCQTTNRTNGRLIAQKQVQARSALDIIRQTSPDTSTYSVQGTTAAAQDPRTLGRA